MPTPATAITVSFEITGVVQGVGFRPFVHQLATDLGLSGHVGNDSTGVFVEVSGSGSAIDEFARRLVGDAPRLAVIDSVIRRPIDRRPSTPGFVIAESQAGDGPRTAVPPDTAVCDDCLAEMRDPCDRRWRHPFITCTNCGPRFTIITGLPYDRPNTTMAAFDMCAACRAEYDDSTDRRHHAQPIGCHDCGPSLRYRNTTGTVDGDPIELTRAGLGRGEIVAIKGLGGYHLACDATDSAAVERLRRRKHRPDKPFAIMAADLDTVRRLARCSDAEAQLLASPARPVVLLDARRDSPIADTVAPGNPLIGVMLPYTPVHHLLFDLGCPPLVMTSANPAGEPITFRDDDIEPQLGPVADAVLGHDRPIAAPCDDSVVRVVGADLLPIRRARGYAPIPVAIGAARRSVLAAGGELKNTFCVASVSHAWVGPHIGDMGSLATLDLYDASLERFCNMYAVSPDVVAVDAHPGYAVSRWARRTRPEPVTEVQHHHAHVASVMAERRLQPDEPVLGFAFDGTGYGPDGSVWGGEVLRATATDFERVAHLAPVLLPGGDAAVEQPSRSALAHLRAAGVAWHPDLAPVCAFETAELALLERQLSGGFGCVPTTSMGRLFDAVASLLGLRQQITYEAQAAIELEHAAARHRGVTPRYRFATRPTRSDADSENPGDYYSDYYGDDATDNDGVTIYDAAPVIASIVDDLTSGLSVEAISDGFHNAVVALVVDAAERSDPAHPVVLSGGVFQNALLTLRCLGALGQTSRTVYTHRTVPPNDGGLALGQAYVAGHRCSARPPFAPKEY